ncbi:MAG TPA: glutamine--fructose-6-phosphate transaminase (isomerizing) [Gaiellaceae bacterium]|jgi:glucosamine--fructose-6-phosphate aminotransferase (isomerizing)|nr:glutamine--fructose-6-phosphate transaminase (isomerizing) [Gaiellaceae bacterium]
MCGIIGYVGSRPSKDLLIAGLERLEFRGYDSAGIALLEEDGLEYVRAVGNLQNLKEAAGPNGSRSTTGVGHTRWATHGGVNEDNAHPLTGCDDSKLAIVLNGIVENYRELKSELEAAGHVFSSQTDAEVVAHLLETVYDGDLVDAVCAVYRRLEGHFTFVVIHQDEPERLVGVRCQTPLVIGLGDGENFLASNLAAFLSETKQIAYPDHGEVIEITPSSVRAVRAEDGSPVELEVQTIDWDEERAEREGFETFMLKEIYEQPEGFRETIGDRVRHGRLVLDTLGFNDEQLKDLQRIVIVACGTAYHAGVVGRYVIEEWGRVPTEPDVASEWIYRNPVLGPNTLVIGISQSGETRDTIQAMQLAKAQGARTVAITNQMGSQITREVDSVLYTRTGLEVGVAASKTFSAQVGLMYLIGLELARTRGTLPTADIEFILDELYKLPEKMDRFLKGDHPIEEIAQRFYREPFFLFLGRHIGLPVALEGALKLKEISYIPTEAYSAGEMKHGPIALLEEGTPVVVVATRMKTVYDKVVSNIQETRARGAHVIAIATEDNEDIQHHANDVIFVPKSPAFLQAVLATLPLQLLAYRIARLRGLNVDQPRNLAKTVTVE